jgi:hypothetical protein
MFSISDVMIDKEEVSMTFQVPVHLPKTPMQELQSFFENYPNLFPLLRMCHPLTVQKY